VTASLRLHGASLAVVALLVCGSAGAAAAFVTLRPQTTDLESAGRWAAAPDQAVGGAGLFDGIQVAVEPELAERLAMAVTGETRPADVADVEAALRAAFAAWQSSVVRFEVTLDGAAARGPAAGGEIDVFGVPESDPVFRDNDFFGLTDAAFAMVDGRVLTNGTVLSGFAFIGADIFLNLDTIAAVSAVFTRKQQPAALQRLVMHEIGHALGFGHPNVFAEFNYDTDNDPLNPMVIDRRDPLADLMLSPHPNVNAVMSNLPNMFEALLLTALTNDELGGRAALYPGPPPTDCPADCDASGAVSIDELVRGVGIALGGTFFLACPAADRDRNLRVTIDELVAGTGAALEGCARPDRVSTAPRVAPIGALRDAMNRVTPEWRG
jgi:hypothetical protein